MRDPRDFGKNLKRILRRIFIEGPNVKNNRLKATILFIWIIICFVIGHFWYTYTLASHLVIVYLLFISSTIWLKRKNLLIIGGCLWLLHIIIFPFIYLCFSKNVPDSFEFDTCVFDIEKTVLNKSLSAQVEELTRDSKWMETLIKEYHDTLAVNFRDVSSLDSIVLGEIVLVPDLIVLEPDPLIGGGGGMVLPDGYSERIIFKVNEGESIHEYFLDVRRPIWGSKLLIDIIKDQKETIDAELNLSTERLNRLLNSNDIWTYDTFLNYSVKIFLFDSPITPHVGIVNQVYVLHLVILMILSSRFFHLLNKE